MAKRYPLAEAILWRAVLLLASSVLTFSLCVLISNPPALMLKNLGLWSMVQTSLPPIPVLQSSLARTRPCNSGFFSTVQALNLSGQRILSALCGARRRVRYEDEEEDGHNEQIAKLELYSQSARGEALLVHALVDDEEVDVLIFKGFSSSLSYRTSPDPTKSILPSRAVIKSIDRIKGPFDPNNIEYLEKGLTWEAFLHTYS
ncbi:uncharacterized protein LOC129311858 [Prosopis cineraria]|uniref:uncharacterized protein LOC129311858 n=1 Tax=Prosopis cineraria TaxID=364024 RepID=UPI00240EFE56|nr:uncharacterized protein LOC129311858 [Prosopis cineraria]